MNCQDYRLFMCFLDQPLNLEHSCKFALAATDIIHRIPYIPQPQMPNSSLFNSTFFRNLLVAIVNMFQIQIKLYWMKSIDRAQTDSNSPQFRKQWKQTGPGFGWLAWQPDIFVWNCLIKHLSGQLYLKFINERGLLYLIIYSVISTLYYSKFKPVKDVQYLYLECNDCST